ncbi:MAG: hypothetical protein JNK74_22625 [Candidatus Hydrogenedentes bacterium]|nr:hypothetical protein [Candidatus Hydrogenedentota bacterium]
MSRFNTLLLSLIFSPCVTFFSPAFAQVPAITEEQDALLKTLITQNEATVRKIESSPLYVDFSWHTTQTMELVSVGVGKALSGAMVTDGRSKYWKHNGLFRQDQRMKHTWTDTGEIRERNTITVLNDTYCALYIEDGRQLQLYRIDDRANLYPALNQVLETCPVPDIFEFGMRYSTTRSLRKAFEFEMLHEPPAFQWTPLESSAAGRSQYTIKSDYITEGFARPCSVTVLDPQCGFLVSESSTFNEKGEAFYIVKTQFQDLGDGVWFPKSATRSISERDEKMSLQVNEVHVGNLKVDEEFTLEAMGFDKEKAIMYEYSSRGRQRTVKGFWEGQWVPWEILPKERREAISEAQHEVESNVSGMKKPTLKEIEP